MGKIRTGVRRFQVDGRFLLRGGDDRCIAPGALASASGGRAVRSAGGARMCGCATPPVQRGGYVGGGRCVHDSTASRRGATAALVMRPCVRRDACVVRLSVVN